MGGMKGVNGCGQPPHSRDSGDCAAEVVGKRPPSGGRGSVTETMPEGGRAERRERAEPEDEKKARWSLAAVERKGMRSKPPRCPLGDGLPRGAEGRWVRRQETEVDLTETYMKRLASCTPHVGKYGGAGVPRWRDEPAAGVRLPRGAAARWTSRSVDRRVPQG